MKINDNKESKLSRVDYHRMRNMVNDVREAGFDPEVVKAKVLEGGSFIRSFRISNALQCAMDVYLKECCDLGVRYRHFIRFNEIHELIYDTCGNPEPEEWELVAAEMREKGGLEPPMEEELVFPRAVDNEGWQLLPKNERRLYRYMHDMALFREIKAELVESLCNPEVAMFVVRPLVVMKKVTYWQAISDRFIEAVLGMVCYEEHANVKALRGAIHTAIDDLKPLPKGK